MNQILIISVKFYQKCGIWKLCFNSNSNFLYLIRGFILMNIEHKTSKVYSTTTNVISHFLNQTVVIWVKTSTISWNKITVRRERGLQLSETTAAKSRWYPPHPSRIFALNAPYLSPLVFVQHTADSGLLHGALTVTLNNNIAEENNKL